jgi:oxygen-dependent protoporphyrinogen oxidase
MRVAVVGGGVSGLAAACEVRRLSPATEVLVLEASSRVGGLVHSERSSEGFLFEHGPDSLYAWRPEGLAAICDFGLSGDLVTGTELPRPAFFSRRAGPMPLPAGALAVGPYPATAFLRAPSRGWFETTRPGQEPFAPYRNGSRTEPSSLARGGSQHAGRRALSPRQVTLVSLQHGMASLPLAMARSLGSRVRLGSAVQRITRGPLGRYRLDIVGRGTLHADAVIMAAPAFHAAVLCAHLSQPLADELGQIQHAGYASVHLSFRRQDIAHPMDGTGFVVPAGAGRSLTICTWMHRKWPARAPGEAVLLRCFVRPPYLSRADVVERALVDLRELMGIHAAPELLHVVSQRRALPSYTAGHPARSGRLYAAASALPGFALAGNALCGAGIPDCITAGREAARRITVPG